MSLTGKALQTCRIERTPIGVKRFDTDPETSWFLRGEVDIMSNSPDRMAAPARRSLPCSSKVPSHRCASGRESTGFMRLILLLLATCVFVAAGTAAPLSPAARTEIDGLMSRLESSGCEFSRNGSWYTGADAKSHLLRKLKYLEDGGAVQTTEQFIELAASNSSTTGQPYLVRCGHGATVESSTWLRSELQILRASGGSLPRPP
jgi:hypothetical protein